MKFLKTGLCNIIGDDFMNDDMIYSVEKIHIDFKIEQVTYPFEKWVNKEVKFKIVRLLS